MSRGAAPLIAWLRRDFDALPIELFRVLGGLLSAAYFASLLAQAREFAASDGWLDHALIRELFPFAGLSLLPPELGYGVYLAALWLGVFSGLAIAAGTRPRLFAAVGYALAFSAARRSLLVMFVDDCVVSLVLLWLLLLPTGRALTWSEWRRRGPSVWREWLARRSPGAAPRCLMANVLLAYAVAGLWKLTSPMWREGFALYAVLRLPLAYFPDAVAPSDLSWLRGLNYAALLCELALPALLALPARFARARLLGLGVQLAFHLGIVASLAIPFANLGMLASAALFFGPEWTATLRRRLGAPELPAEPPPPDLGARVAPALLVLIALSALREVPGYGMLSAPATRVLWTMGLFQDYRLFNWIDSKNYRGHFELESADGTRKAGAALWPRSSRTRSALLRAYLFGAPERGSLWIPVPPARVAALRASILGRAAARFCAGAPDGGRWTLRSQPGRVSRRDPAAAAGPSWTSLLEFECLGSRARVLRGPAEGPG